MTYDERCEKIREQVQRAMKRIKLARPAIRLDEYPLAQSFKWKP